MPSNYLEIVKNKRQANTQASTQQKTTDDLLGELKEVQLAALLGSQGKSTVILTDKTDLGARFKELADNVAGVIKAIETTDGRELSKAQIDALKGVKEAIANLTQGIKNSQSDSRKQTEYIISAIKSLKLNPNINLPEPKVTVQPQKLNLAPLQETIREILSKKPLVETVTAIDKNVAALDRFDLTRYRAQDITEYDGGSRQYVGFVNPEGDWYIIENDVRANKMRYIFGSGSYSKHFKLANTYKYQLLDKALNAAA